MKPIITNLKIYIGMLCAVIWLMPQHVFAAPSLESWYLPTDLSDQNVAVGFEVDSTWHMVHGRTSGVSGKAWLANPADPLSISLKIEIPVAKFDTDNSSRDEELRQVMAADEFPQVIFNATGLSGSCTPTVVKAQGACTGELNGTLQIRAIQMPVKIPVVIKSETGGVLVEGKLPITWSEYGVEDPSIFLVATVDPIATVHFSARLGEITKK